MSSSIRFVSRFFVLSLLAVACVAAYTQPAGAAAYNWNGLDNALWSVGPWNDTLPGVGNVAVFSDPGAGANVDVDAGATAGGITFNNNVANTEIKSTSASTLTLDNGGGTVNITADAGTHTISANFDSTTGGGGAGGAVNFNGPGKIILSGNNTIGKPGGHQVYGFGINGVVEITGGSTTTVLPSAADPVTANNGGVGGNLTVSGTGSFTAGGHDIGLGGTITVKDQGKITLVDSGVFDTGGGVLNIKDQGTLTVDRANVQGGGAGPYGGGWTVGGLILGMGWGSSSSIINQDGGTVNLPYFDPAGWEAGNGWGLCFGPGPWGGVGSVVKGTYNLSGGTLNVSAIGPISDDGAGHLVRPEVQVPGSEAIFNFNGGLLKATQSDSIDPRTVAEGSNHLMFLLTHAYVQAGGAKIDTSGFNASINQALEHDSALGGTPDGGLEKLGDGILTLLQANTYTGDTKVDAGVLAILNAYLDDASSVSIASGAGMDLNFAGNDVIAGLTLGGASQGPGIYNNGTDPTYFTGTGSLQIIPEPSTLVLLGMGLAGLLAYAWRRRRA